MNLLTMLVKLQTTGLQAVNAAFNSVNSQANQLAYTVGTIGFQSQRAFDRMTSTLKGVRAGFDGVQQNVASLQAKLLLLNDPRYQGFLREEKILTAKIRTAELVAEHGKLGAALIQVNGAFEKVGAAGAVAGNVIAMALNRASIAVLGFATAGFAGTAQGNLFALRLQLMSREIGSLFIPQVNAASNAVGRFVEYLHSLSGAQQEATGRWLTGGIAAMGLFNVLSRFIGVGPAAMIALAVGAGIGTKSLAELQEVAKQLLEPLLRIAVAIGPAIAQQALAILRAMVPVFQALASVLERTASYAPDILRLMITLLLARQAATGLLALAAAGRALGFALAPSLVNPIIAALVLLAAAVAYLSLKWLEMRGAIEAATLGLDHYRRSLSQEDLMKDPRAAGVLGDKDPARRRAQAAADVDAAERAVEAAQARLERSGRSDPRRNALMGALGLWPGVGHVLGFLNVKNKLEERTRAAQELQAAQERLARAQEVNAQVGGKPPIGGAGRNQLVPAQPTITSDLGAAYREAQLAALRLANPEDDVPRKQVALLDLINRNVVNVEAAIRGQPPALKP